LHRDMNLIYKAARDFVTADVERVLIDDEEEYRKVREFLQLLGPQYLDRVQHYNHGKDLFDDFKVNDELQRLLKPKINLPSGGSIVIESTEALTVIDVNSGKFTGGKNLEDTIVKTNMEAAAEIARQVRLRDIGGIIVVDFIDMASEGARNKVIKALEDGLRRDRTRATIQSFSNLGLLEFTRKRIGKDLGAQLRGTCPTCSGIGSVMSPQSVAIDTLRHVRQNAHHHHDHQPVLVHAAPTVVAQMEFWYEGEVQELAKELNTKIHVRVDPLIHPERSRVERITKAIEQLRPIRVGDEVEVDLLPGRLPNPTSATAVIGDRIVEVENAANNAGNTARIRVLDVDDDEDYVLAELVAAAVGEAKKKRRRGGKGRKVALTAAEQAAELRELAAEAASQLQARPPIGITTVTEEEEAEDPGLAAEAKGEHQPDAIIIGEHEPREGEAARGKRKRRRRRRGRGGQGGAERFDVAAQVGITPASAAAQTDFDDEEEDDAQPPMQAVVPSTNGATMNAETGHGKRRRRRRRRGRGGGGGGERAEGLTGSLPMSPSVPDRHVFRVDPKGSAQPTGMTAPREPSRAIAPIGKATPPAVDAPPPHLTLPAEEFNQATPTRRRRTRVSGVAGELETTVVVALPAPADDKPKRTRKKVEPATGGAAAPKKKASAAASGVKKTSTRKKASTSTTTRKKKTS